MIQPIKKSCLILDTKLLSLVHTMPNPTTVQTQSCQKLMREHKKKFFFIYYLFSKVCCNQYPVARMCARSLVQEVSWDTRDNFSISLIPWCLWCLCSASTLRTWFRFVSVTFFARPAFKNTSIPTRSYRWSRDSLDFPLLSALHLQRLIDGNCAYPWENTKLFVWHLGPWGWDTAHCIYRR